MKRGSTPNMCLFCFAIMNSVLWNLSCLWILWILCFVVCMLRVTLDRVCWSGLSTDYTVVFLMNKHCPLLPPSTLFHSPSRIVCRGDRHELYWKPLAGGYILLLFSSAIRRATFSCKESGSRLAQNRRAKQTAALSSAPKQSSDIRWTTATDSQRLPEAPCHLYYEVSVTVLSAFS